MCLMPRLGQPSALALVALIGLLTTSSGIALRQSLVANYEAIVASADTDWWSFADYDAIRRRLADWIVALQ